jgi:hypothetical protein
MNKGRILIPLEFFRAMFFTVIAVVFLIPFISYSDNDKSFITRMPEEPVI